MLTEFLLNAFTHLSRVGLNMKVISKEKIGSNSFSLDCSPFKFKGPNLPYYLSVFGVKTLVGFIFILCVLVLCGMQTGLTQIWTHIIAPLSSEHNGYQG